MSECKISQKFDNFWEIIKQNEDTKIDASFPSAQFFLEGNHSPGRLDISRKRGGLLVY